MRDGDGALAKKTMVKGWIQIRFLYPHDAVDSDNYKAAGGQVEECMWDG